MSYRFKKYEPDVTHFDIVIPEGVTSVPDSAFSNATDVTTMKLPSTLPASAITTDWFPFSTTNKLDLIEMTGTLADLKTTINKSYTSNFNAVISNGITIIGEYAFDSCTGLTSITIPDSVTNIGVRAFYGCTGLTSITIPNSVTSISDYTFTNCSGLTSITIPDSVTSIGVSAFTECTGLTSITIPNSVTSIGEYAFSNTGLTSITIPNSVTIIDNFAFNAESLTEITYEGYHSDWVSYGLDSGFDTGITLYCLDGTYATGQQSGSGSGSGY